MTVFQVVALMEDRDDGKKTTDTSGAKQTMSIAEYRRLARGQL